ncbi:MAG TPA: endo-1,4-beta-xylanase [Holophaga sp.]|jgi:endo-1,4-beta-xylanase|nr:endo-1,4-beta-xylanase [Holophaga sp.]
MLKRLSPLFALVALTATAQEAPALKQFMPSGVYLGAAVNQRVSDGADAADRAIVLKHFNSVTPENLLKWEAVHPKADSYNFEPADRYVEMGTAAGMFVVGHTLVWHQQTPRWVFQNEAGKPVDRETLLTRMHEHIKAVAGRYRGRIGGWDVVNEAFEDDGTLRQTGWSRCIGPDFIEKAFEFAHEADPNAQLYYNDFNLWKPAKRKAVEKLVASLKAKGIRIDAVGEQAHYNIAGPTLDEIEAVIMGLSAQGVKVALTELDMDVLPTSPDMWGADLSKQRALKTETNIYTNGLPDKEQKRLGEHYAGLFRLIKKHQAVFSRVTFWGVTDRNSWLNDFPIRGRVNYPLLWGRDGKPKPAFFAVMEALKQK